MVVVQSLREAIAVVREFPLLLLYVVAGSSLISGIAAIPLIGTFLLFVAFPALSGGLYEVFKQASDGDAPTVEAFTGGAESYFRSLLGAHILLGVIVVILLFVFAFLLGAVSLANGPTLLTSELIGLVVFGAVCWFAFVLVTQFVDVSIVVGNQTAVGSIRHSAQLVLRNPVATFGYTLIRVSAMLILSAVVYGLMFGLMYTLGNQSIIVFGLLALVFSPLVLAGHAVLGAVSYAYHLEFYARLTDAGMTLEEN